jgi:parallel beta helix pectate lyase-like protein
MLKPISLRQAALALFVACASASGSSAQQTWYVDVSATAPGDGSIGAPFSSLQGAVDHPTSQDGDTFVVAPGTYVENLLVDDLSVTIIGAEGAARTTIRAAGPGDVLRVEAPAGSVVTLEGLTLRGGQGPSSDGLHVVEQSFVFARDCVMTDNDGAGVHTDYDVSIEECTIVGNGIGVQSTGVGNIQMQNSIVWDNLDCIQVNPSFHFIRWCTLPCTSLASNSQNADPLFFDAAHGDFSLRSGSPCIDAGDPADHDTDGSRVDMGALDYDPLHLSDFELYCSTSPNAVGTGAVLGVQGSASASADDLLFFARGAPPQQFGVFFHGSGTTAVPFAGGTLCVSGAVERLLPASGISSGGTALHALDRSMPAAAAFAPGSTRSVQFWYRDPGAPHGSGSNLSDALIVRTRP